MVSRMPENEEDPGANTQMFQAFVQEGRNDPAETAKPNRTPLIIGAVVAVVVIALIVWLLVR